MTELLTPAQVCDLLTISKKTLYGWTSRQEIPHVKVGRLLRFRRSEIDLWLTENTVQVFDAPALAAAALEGHRP